jgi:hypothetical protein
VAKRISRIIRRARTTARDRGVPVDRLLPVAEVLIGVLVGLILGTVAWQIVARTLLTYRMATVLTVSLDAGGLSQKQRRAAAGRGEEAAVRVRDHVASLEFQKEWLREAKRLGLGGNRRLWAEVGGPLAGEGNKYAVALLCEGRPDKEARRALDEARDLLRDMSERLKIKPQKYDERKAKLENYIAAKKREAATIKVDLAKCVRGPEEQRELNQLEARVRKAKALWEQERQGLPGAKNKLGKKKDDLVEAHEKVTGESLPAEQLLAGKGKLAGLERVDDVRLDELTREQQRLEAMVSLAKGPKEDEGKEGGESDDCSADHPAKKRLAQIREILEPNRVRVLLATIRGLQSQVDNQQQRVDKAKAALDAVNIDERGLLTKKYGGREAERIRYQKQLTTLSEEIAGANRGLGDLGKEPHIPVTVEAKAEIVRQSPPWFWAFVLGGVLCGVCLTVVLHRQVVPAFSVIDDELDLADRLRAPVLGTVPHLAMLERRH